MTRLRPLLRDFLVYGLSDGMLRAIGLITLPIYTRALSPAEYGTWATLATVALLVAGVLILGGDSAFARLWYEMRNDTERRALTSSALVFLGGTSLLVFALVALMAGPVARAAVGDAAAAPLVIAALAGVPLSIVSPIAAQVLRNQFRAGLVALHNGMAALLSVALSLLFVFPLHMGLIGIFVGHALALALVLPIRLFAIRDLLTPKLSPRLLQGLLSYGLPLVPTTIAYWVFTSSDRLVLVHLTDLAQVGLYSVVATLTGVLAIANGALGQAWSPHGMKAYHDDPDAARTYFGQVAVMITVGFGTLAVVGSLFAAEGLRLVASAHYAQAAPAVAPLALSAVFLATTQVTAAGISIRKRTHLFAVYAIGAAVLNLTLNLLLVPRYGFIAAAWTTAVAYAALTLAYHLSSRRLWRVAYPPVRMPAVLATVVLFTSAAAFVPHAQPETLLVKATLLLAYGASMAAILTAHRIRLPLSTANAPRRAPEPDPEVP